MRSKVFASDGLIAQARNEVSWARQGLELLEAYPARLLRRC